MLEALAGDGYLVPHGIVLDQAAETNAPTMGTHWHIVLCGHEDDGHDIIHPGDPDRVDLAVADGAGLEQLGKSEWEQT